MSKIGTDNFSKTVPMWAKRAHLAKKAHAWKVFFQNDDWAWCATLCGQIAVINDDSKMFDPGDTPRCKRCESAAKAKAHT